MPRYTWYSIFFSHARPGIPESRLSTGLDFVHPNQISSGLDLFLLPSACYYIDFEARRLWLSVTDFAKLCHCLVLPLLMLVLSSGDSTTHVLGLPLASHFRLACRFS